MLRLLARDASWMGDVIRAANTTPPFSSFTSNTTHIITSTSKSRNDIFVKTKIGVKKLCVHLHICGDELALLHNVQAGGPCLQRRALLLGVDLCGRNLRRHAPPLSSRMGELYCCGGGAHHE